MLGWCCLFVCWRWPWASVQVPVRVSGSALHSRQYSRRARRASITNRRRTENGPSLTAFLLFSWNLHSRPILVVGRDLPSHLHLPIVFFTFMALGRTSWLGHGSVTNISVEFRVTTSPGCPPPFLVSAPPLVAIGVRCLSARCLTYLASSSIALGQRLQQLATIDRSIHPSVPSHLSFLFLFLIPIT